MSARELSRSLGDLRVGDAMHTGLISCSPDKPLRFVAQLLASHRVHAVVVAHPSSNATPNPVWTTITDTDVLEASKEHDLDRTTARSIAHAPVETASTGNLLATVAASMLKTRHTHVLVVDELTGRPIGMLSSLDVVRALAGQPL